MSKKAIRLRFGKRLREWRVKRKLTQEGLADRASVQYKHYQLLEGKDPPAVKIDTIDKLASALRIKPSSLLE